MLYHRRKKILGFSLFLLTICSVGVDLLQDLVDVDRVGLHPPLALRFAIFLGDRLGVLTDLLGGLSGSFKWHDFHRNWNLCHGNCIQTKKFSGVCRLLYGRNVSSSATFDQSDGGCFYVIG